mmetsp:Transcript_48004/g.98091  ORF Transcript_48004/g.98091 Transcript_48004/m.98091 type:complete len:98 (+) Transcript_48004:198-491(+)
MHSRHGKPKKQLMSSGITLRMNLGGVPESRAFWEQYVLKTTKTQLHMAPYARLEKTTFVVCALPTANGIAGRLLQEHYFQRILTEIENNIHCTLKLL